LIAKLQYATRTHFVKSKVTFAVLRKYQSAHGYPLEKVFLLAHHNGEGLWYTAQIGGILISKIAYRRIQKAGAERSGCQMDDPYFRP